MATYADVIRKAERDLKKHPPQVAGMTIEALNERVAVISNLLKGFDVDAHERLMLNGERRACRDEIARRAS